jgi:ATP-dependent RNA helicase DeaD
VIDPKKNDTGAQRGTPSEVTLEQLPSALREAADRIKWSTLTPVQAQSIPSLLQNKNMMIQARTGSGKTGAFLLPMLEQLNAEQDVCQALVLVPTRELASQVWQEAKILFGENSLSCTTVYGGVGYGKQVEALKKGVQIVVGTPGRVLDHLLKRTMNLKHLKMLIFDEADRMLSMGFYPDMKKLQDHLPKHNIHTCMFSATFPAFVIRVAEEFAREPEFLNLSSEQVHVAETQHIFYTIPDMDKDRSLVRIIEVENPASAIIFCNTKANVEFVNIVLQRFGYDADSLSADLTQQAREQVLLRLRKGTLRFLVATDVAARGLDIPELSHVIQYEPSEDLENYIHRSGRTGRAGASGIAMTLVSRTETSLLNRIARRYDIDLQEWLLPKDEDVVKIVTERLTALLEARLRERDKLQTERSIRFLPLARSLVENEDESAIIAMLLDDYYQQQLHAPLVPPPEIQSTEKKSKKTGRSRRHHGRQRRKPRSY